MPFILIAAKSVQFITRECEIHKNGSDFGDLHKRSSFQITNVFFLSLSLSSFPQTHRKRLNKAYLKPIGIRLLIKSRDTSLMLNSLDCIHRLILFLVSYCLFVCFFLSN